MLSFYSEAHPSPLIAPPYLDISKQPFYICVGLGVGRSIFGKRGKISLPAASPVHGCDAARGDVNTIQLPRISCFLAEYRR
jgi:hypothetical protein